MTLPASVRASIAEAFGPGRAAQALLMLPAEAHLTLNPPYERVLLAIVGLSEGDLGRLAEFSRSAMADWRDVLYWWETPELVEKASVPEQWMEESDE